MKKAPPTTPKKEKKEYKKIPIKRPPFIVILLFAFVAFSPFYFNSEKRQATTMQFAATTFPIIENKADLELDFIEEIPDGMENGRCKQPTIQQLHQIGQSGKYQTVIRLNGEGKDSGGVSLAVQDSILRGYGVRTIFLNAHGERQNEVIHNILDKYKGVLVHCLHGYDRTGAMVGYHLRQSGLSIKEVIDHNKWESYLDKKGCDYYQYFKQIL